MTENDYRSDLTAKGYAAPSLKTWEPNKAAEMHTHDDDLYLLIQEGEMTLEVEGAGGLTTTTIAPGETIEVPAMARHTERAGAEGVTFFVARR